MRSILFVLALVVGLTSQAWAQSGPGDFVFKDQNRRDPFTYFVPAATKPADGDTPAGPNLVSNTVNSIYATALVNLAAGSFKAAIETADKGLSELAKYPNFADSIRLQVLFDKLSLAKQAAERLQNRLDAEAAFKNLHYKLAGVIARAEGRSLAILGSSKGTMVQKGDVLEIPGSTERVLVQEIQAERVVVSFRNYKMELLLTQ